MQNKTVLMLWLHGRLIRPMCMQVMKEMTHCETKRCVNHQFIVNRDPTQYPYFNAWILILVQCSIFLMWCRTSEIWWLRAMAFSCWKGGPPGREGRWPSANHICENYMTKTERSGRITDQRRTSRQQEQAHRSELHTTKGTRKIASRDQRQTALNGGKTNLLIKLFAFKCIYAIHTVAKGDSWQSLMIHQPWDTVYVNPYNNNNRHTPLNSLKVVWYKTLLYRDKSGLLHSWSYLVLHSLSYP